MYAAPKHCFNIFYEWWEWEFAQKYSSGLIRAPERERQKCKNESAENIDQSVENECAKFLSTK